MSTRIELERSNFVNRFIDEGKAMIPIVNDALVMELCLYNWHNLQGLIHLVKAYWKLQRSLGAPFVSCYQRREDN